MSDTPRIDSSHFWFKAQPCNYTINFGLRPSSLGRPADEAKGERQIGSFILPPFQRPCVWTPDQQTRLIESLWIGMPISGYVFNEFIEQDLAYDRWLLDGQQRWTTINAYVADAFPVFGYRFSELTPPEQRRFMNIPFPCHKTEVGDPAMLEEIHNRLAYGGTPHELRA